MTDVLLETSLAPDVLELKSLLLQEDDLHAQRMLIRKEVGKILSKIRVSRDLSFREAGKLLGCDPGLLNRVEKGKAWAYTIVEKALLKYSETSLFDTHD